MAWIYENDPDNKLRFILGKKGIKPLICFGINPSTATPDNTDRTIQSVERIAYANGFDSWIMLNVYPQRATNPNDLDKSLNVKFHSENLENIEKIFQEGNLSIWSAWGTLIEKRDYLKHNLYDIYLLSLRYKCNWITAGKESIKGHPHHPLYLRKDESFRPFNINHYLENIIKI